MTKTYHTETKINRIPIIRDKAKSNYFTYYFSAVFRSLFLHVNFRQCGINYCEVDLSVSSQQSTWFFWQKAMSMWFSSAEYVNRQGFLVMATSSKYSSWWFSCSKSPRRTVWYMSDYQSRGMQLKWEKTSSMNIHIAKTKMHSTPCYNY